MPITADEPYATAWSLTAYHRGFKDHAQIKLCVNLMFLVEAKKFLDIS